MSDPTGPTLLVVDDDDVFRRTIASALERRGFVVTTAESPAIAEARAREAVFEYALVDVRMPGGSGIDLVAKLRDIDDGTRVVILTGYGTIANAVDAMRGGAVDYLTKPVDADMIERALLGRRDARPDGMEEVPSLDRVEYEYLQRVISDAAGNVSEAARRLRMHRRSLQRKLSKAPPTR